jgi:hypothetical protein
MPKKTVIFEEKYGEDISRFKTTMDIDAFLKAQEGTAPKVTKNIPVVVSRRGKTIDLSKRDINSKFKETINKNSSGMGLLNCVIGIFR